MTVLPSALTSRRLFKWPLFKCPKYDKTFAKSLVKHSCWSAIILGLIMLTLGIVLRSSLVTKQSATVTSSGLLFIFIGIFIICIGPIAALYDVLSNHKRRLREESSVEDGQAVSASPRPSAAIDPPSYLQVMTDLKSPSDTISMQFFPRVLSAEVLSDSRPPPPSYEEVELNDDNTDAEDVKNDSRRMTSP